MGIIRAAMQAVSGGFSDQYLEKIVPYDMGDQTVFTYGVTENAKDNKKGTANIISNGSKIQVYDNQMMILVDGGKIVDYTAEPGLYEVSNSSMPSLFNGQFGDSLKEAFERVKFGGGTPLKQEVFYINLQEIKGIKFGTRNPINYFDNMYNAELFLRAHGTYSIKIVNPLQFYAEVIPRNGKKVEITDINEQYLSEFLEALQAAINQMSADGQRISHVTSKARELGKYMANVLDEEWNQMRGMEIQAVGLASVSYDEKSQELINMRNEGAMLSDPTIAQGYMVKNMSEGVKNAGSNSAGAMQGFMGVGIGASAMGNMMNGFTQMSQNLQGQQMANQQMQQTQPQPQVEAGAAAAGSGAESAANSWTCECGSINTGKFCSNCGKPAPAPKIEWTCECGSVNTGKFCSNCGKPAPAAEWTCECGSVNTGKFCSNCGKPRV